MQLKLPIGETAVSSVWDFGFMYVKLLFSFDAFLQKRFRGRQPDRTEIRRAADALLRRGHAWGDIRRALERYDPDFPEE